MRKLAVIIIFFTFSMISNAQYSYLDELGTTINSYNISNLNYDTVTGVFHNPVLSISVSEDGLKSCIRGLNAPKDTLFHFGHPELFFNSIELFFSHEYSLVYEYSGDVVDWSHVCATEYMKDSILNARGLNIDSLRTDYENYLTQELAGIIKVYEQIRFDSIISSSVQNLRSSDLGFSVEVKIVREKLEIIQTTYWENDELFVYASSDLPANKDLKTILKRISETTPEITFAVPVYWVFSGLTI